VLLAGAVLAGGRSPEPPSPRWRPARTAVRARDGRSRSRRQRPPSPGSRRGSGPGKGARRRPTSRRSRSRTAGPATCASTTWAGPRRAQAAPRQRAHDGDPDHRLRRERAYPPSGSSSSVPRRSG